MSPWLVLISSRSSPDPDPEQPIQESVPQSPGSSQKEALLPYHEEMIKYAVPVSSCIYSVRGYTCSLISTYIQSNSADYPPPVGFSSGSEISNASDFIRTGLDIVPDGASHVPSGASEQVLNFVPGYFIDYFGAVWPCTETVSL